MVQFNDDGFTVNVETVGHPHDNYVATVNDIINLLQSVDNDMRVKGNYYYLLEMLRAMMPDEVQLRKISA